MDIAILLLPGMRTFEVAAALEVFNGGSPEGEPPRHRIRMVSSQAEEITLEYEFTVETSSLKTAKSAEILIVPGVVNIERHLAEIDNGTHEELIATIMDAHSRGATVVSLCTGVFLLAAAGLLDHKEATTHWYWTDRLRQPHPHIRVRSNVLFTHDSQLHVWTSAGVSAAIDLCLALLADVEGTVASMESARGMVVAAIRTGGQKQFIPPRHELQELVGSEYTDLQDLVRRTLDQPWTVKSMAAAARQSPRTLQRRFSRAFGMSLTEWLVRERIATAQELLTMTDLPIDQIARRAGFHSADLLRKHFATAVGTSPSRHRESFQNILPEGQQTATGRRSTAT
ncbi:GlxA family transcriptional regulator [Arthrobacter sp. NPDC090010]|uniref:GlxA family transcriptional regulator n=1 Tax=Arthrobacter sp. NPDC090010 TaxID=3363942 RepID=UPI0038173202